MVKAAFVRVREDKVERLRAWAEELRARSGEVEEAFAQQSTRQERAFLLHGLDAPVMVLLYDFDDPGSCARGVFSSTLAIDQDYKRAMDEVMAEPVEAELLYEVGRRPG
jgi:Family of unknown function (DUF6176)